MFGNPAGFATLLYSQTVLSIGWNFLLLGPKLLGLLPDGLCFLEGLPFLLLVFANNVIKPALPVLLLQFVLFLLGFLQLLAVAAVLLHLLAQLQVDLLHLLHLLLIDLVKILLHLDPLGDLEAQFGDLF